MIVPSGQGAKMVATDVFGLFEMAKEYSQSVATLLVGSLIPLTNAEFAAYNTYRIAMARLEQQTQKGI